jgi:hypothetical protein
MNGCSVISLTYNFDYGQFEQPDLQNRAKNTLGEFLSFVRSSFDALIENGRVLQDFYYECLAFCPKGKKVFEEWLASDDFGASRYIAKSAMEIYLWFEKLSPKVQRLVRQNVQNWSVSALRQLTKVSTDLVKELVRNGKKTAAQIKEEGGNARVREGGSVGEKEGVSERGKEQGRETGNIVDKSSQSHPSEEANDIPNSHPSEEASNTPTSLTPPLLKAELAPGMRIIVTGDDYGWNGYRGIILSQNGESWWVLLDHVVAQGSTTKNLYKSNQIEIEGINNNAEIKDVFTAVQVEKKIKEILAQRDTEKASDLEQEKVAALKEAVELEKMRQEKEELAQKLLDKERELEKVRSLTIKNQQLEQRIAELENTNKNSSNNILDHSKLEKSIAPLTSEVERLSSLLLTREQEVAQLKAINEKQQSEIKILSQYEMSKHDISDKEAAIIAKFGEIGEESGWNGWSRRGYRTNSGVLYTGINAIAAFISDLTQDHNYQT